MSTPRALSLLERLIHEARESTDGVVTVTPVLVDDLAIYEDVIRAALRLVDGVFLNASECAEGVVGEPDEGLEAVLRGVSERFEVVSDKDVVRVGLTDAGEAPLSQGQRNLSGLASAFFASVLRSAQIGAIAYDETDLDADSISQAWTLAVRESATLKLGVLRHLLVFVGYTRGDTTRHAGPEFSARYRLDSKGWSRRNDWAIDRARIRHIAPRRRPHVVLFLGAGFSASSGLPLGNELRNTALRTLVGTGGIEDASRLALAFYKMVAETDRLLDTERGVDPTELAANLTLERVLREERRRHSPENMPTLENFAKQNGLAVQAPGKAARELARIFGQDGIVPKPIVVTVNFDTVFDGLIGAKSQVFVTDEQFEGAPAHVAAYLADKTALVPVLKLHGSIEVRSSIVADVDQTMPGLSAQRVAALRSLVGLEQRVPWIYVGYSMRDLDLEPFLGQREIADQLDETWVTAFPDANVERFAGRWRSGSWQEAGMRQISERRITQTADVFCEELATAWGSEDN